MRLYKSNDGKEFILKSSRDKYNQDTKTIKKIFRELIKQHFFENYRIPSYFHNSKIENLGNPSIYDWNPEYRGYRLVSGKMGNGDDIVTFKLRKNKLLIFRWYTHDSDWTRKGKIPKIYLGSIEQNSNGLWLSKKTSTKKRKSK